VQIAVDQLLWSPIWNGTYILLLGLMKRDGLGAIADNIRTSTIPLISSGLKLWPAAHVITYGIVPVENRLLWVDFVEILW
jgi:protein Mpv17